MATVSKTLFRGSVLTGGSAITAYTTPASTTTVVTSIVVANSSAAAGTFTVSLGGVALATLVAVGGNDSTVIDIKQVLTATQTITVNASATTVSFHISGVEIS